MDTMEKATQREQSGLGMKIMATIIITPAANMIAWMLVERTSTYWKAGDGGVRGCRGDQAG